MLSSVLSRVISRGTLVEKRVAGSLLVLVV
jgi:hypothetical protein